jgi:hypothetical protein
MVDALGEPLDEDVAHTHGEIDLEPEDIHKAKWQLYLQNKEELLADGWIITKKATEGGISVGATVQTKARANRREGVVVAQTEADINGKKKWLVMFGNDEEPTPMTPQTLKLLERNEDAYVWTLVEDSEPSENAPAPEEYLDTSCGLVGFNFPEAFKPPTDTDLYRRPYLKLLQKMWPGNWEQQLRQLNNKAAAENATHSGKNWREIHPVSKQEWWVFIGVLISAGPQGKGGNKLWERSTSTQREGFYGMTKPINYGPNGGLNIMAEYRFKQIKHCFPWAFQDNVWKTHNGQW